MAASNELRLFEDEVKQDVKNYLSLDNLVTRVKLGEVWQLGEHRLMCGDACKREDIELLLNGRKPDLVLQDPPYGMKCQDRRDITDEAIATFTPQAGRISAVEKVPKHIFMRLIGDDNQDMARNNYELIKDLCKLQIIWGGQYFAHFLPISGAWIFWDKLNGDNCFSAGELAWVSQGKRLRKYVHMWCGCVRAGSHDLNLKTRVHPTQKPVELHIKILEDFSKSGDLVLECFGGSGTTLIACNECGRVCYMMELSPEYCEIIIRRWEILSGKEAELIA
ncbi:MAG: site-specific DNA-methyltransferase [Synergistaceae bacterium]|nr:site-specific DNA-methyltransferase [Synergistaceae bacterium]